MLTPGSLLQNRYEIVQLLGQGGFGAVYRANDRRLTRSVAIKAIYDRSLDFARQFEREARTLANLRHVALPIVTDHFVEADGQYLVMEYVPGESLHEYLSHQPNYRLSESAALNIATPIMDALQYLHTRVPPIIHRDIKPRNIRIADDGRVFLVDFGISKAYDPTMKTTVGARAVTPGFSPLEQYGFGPTDTRADLYALGATIYVMLSAVVPPEATQRALQDTLAPLRQFNPAISPQVEAVTMRLLAMRPDDRYPDIAAARRELTQPPRVRRCPRCGTVIRNTSRFCISCGAGIALPSQPTRARPASSTATQTTVIAARPKTPTGTPIRQPVATPPQMTRGAFAPAPPTVAMPPRKRPSALPRTLPLPGGARSFSRRLRLLALSFAVISAAAVLVMSIRVRQTQDRAAEATATVHAAQTAERADQATAGAQDTATALAAIIATRQVERQTATAQARATATAQAQATATARVMRATATAQARATATAQAPVATAAALIRGAPRVFGPSGGRLPHRNDNFVSVETAKTGLLLSTPLVLTDFIVEVRFSNPYDRSRGRWDYGLYFRYTDQYQYRVAITSEQEWSLELYGDPAGRHLIASGDLWNLDVAATGSNAIRLVVQGETAILFVNDQYVATLDIAQHQAKGMIMVASGMFRDDEIIGESTPYTDFTIYSLDQ